MLIAIVSILFIQLFAFLATLILGGMKEQLIENFGLGINQVYKPIISKEGVTWSVEQFLEYLNKQYLLCAVIALIATLAYFLYYKNGEGSLGKRQPIWWITFIGLILFALLDSIVLFKLPSGLEASGVIGYTTPFTIFVMAVPFWLSTLIFCAYDAPLAYSIKNALFGNRN